MASVFALLRGQRRWRGAAHGTCYVLRRQSTCFSPSSVRADSAAVGSAERGAAHVNTSQRIKVHCAYIEASLSRPPRGCGLCLIFARRYESHCSGSRQRYAQPPVVRWARAAMDHFSRYTRRGNEATWDSTLSHNVGIDLGGDDARLCNLRPC